MFEWWVSIGTVGQIFATIAIPASVILLIQTILLFFGIGSEDHGDAGDDGGHDFGHDAGDAEFDTDAGHDGVFGDQHDAHGDGMLDGGLRLFTFRGLIAFFSVMGWVGVICAVNNVNTALSVLISVLSGVFAMMAVAYIMKWLLGLQYDGTENVKFALGVSGTVYMKVPPARTGKGKVTCIIQGKLSEKFAVTDEETELKYGEEVVIIGITGEETLIVKRKK